MLHATEQAPAPPSIACCRAGPTSTECCMWQRRPKLHRVLQVAAQAQLHRVLHVAAHAPVAPSIACCSEGPMNTSTCSSGLGTKYGCQQLPNNHMYRGHSPPLHSRMQYPTVKHPHCWQTWWQLTLIVVSRGGNWHLLLIAVVATDTYFWQPWWQLTRIVDSLGGSWHLLLRVVLATDTYCCESW